MTLGRAPMQADLLRTTSNYCSERVSPDSIYGILHRECHRLFPDEMFADLFTDIGRQSVPPMIVAVVMVLQRIEGCSDREAVDRFSFDTRWKYAAGGLDFDYPGFVHTVLVDMRARLARSTKPNRLFDVTLDAARSAGLVGRKRVLDSTALYDAVATMDTVTLIRSAIRGLLAVVDLPLEDELRKELRRDDDYKEAGKPVCDYDDQVARVQLVDALARDAHALLAVLDGRTLESEVSEATALLATVVGQDLDTDAAGVFRIARRVAKDRIISTVDTEARHGHKTAARGFDGYKGHIAVDPDSEIITATAVSAGNIGDADLAVELLAGDVLPAGTTDTDTDSSCGRGNRDEPDAVEPDREDITATVVREGNTGTTEPAAVLLAADVPAAAPGSDNHDEPADSAAVNIQEQPAAYGDAAYGSGEVLAALEAAGVKVMVKVQPPVAPGGRFAKDRFAIDLKAGTVTCPAQVTAPIRFHIEGSGIATFGTACTACPLLTQCTSSAHGRTVNIGPYEDELVRARATQRDPEWKTDYRATRPKVERKIGHLMRRKHGGRRARVRGQCKVGADFSLLGVAVNLARMAVLKMASTSDGGWAVAAG